MDLKTRFGGNSIEVMVDGTNSFIVPKFGDKFTWGHLKYVFPFWRSFFVHFCVFFLVRLLTMSLLEACGSITMEVVSLSFFLSFFLHSHRPLLHRIGDKESHHW
jgi:hypothetical protein